MGKKTVPVAMEPADIPLANAPRGRPRKYDWTTLEVGKSLVVQQVKGLPTSEAVRSSCSFYARHHGGRFKVRVMSGGRIQIYRSE